MARTADAAAPVGPPRRRRRGALRRRPLRRRPRRALPLRERHHDGARGVHARLVRLRLHADEDALAALDDRRRDPRRAPAARRLHGRRGRDSACPGLALFAILFLWQLPHFFAIGWRHREDYAKRGRRGSSRSSTRRDARRRRQTLLWTAVLLPISLLPVARRHGGLRLRLRRASPDAPFPRGVAPLRARDRRTAARARSSSPRSAGSRRCSSSSSLDRV